MNGILIGFDFQEELLNEFKREALTDGTIETLLDGKQELFFLKKSFILF